jgi:LmbE family N-acetylglucosaminyl deacetylase
MAVVYILAHFDDEYCALPMVRARAAAGVEQYFLYVSDYPDPADGARRKAETRAFLGWLGIDPDRAVHVGAGRGVLDGQVHRRLPEALAALREATLRLGPVERLAAPAWEGGHPDHDMCALLAVLLGRELGAPVEQFGLYNGRGLAGRLFRACDTIPENGPTTRVSMPSRAWRDYVTAVRFFPSQWRSWLGLWPAMFATFALRGFRYQALDEARVRQRPHAGRLLYERMFATSYEEVRACADAALEVRPGPA